MTQLSLIISIIIIKCSESSRGRCIWLRCWCWCWMMPRAYILNRECLKKTFHVVLSVSLIVIWNSLDRCAVSAYCSSPPIRLRPQIQISRIYILHHNQLISICDSIVRHRTICEPLSASNLFKNYKLNLILRRKKNRIKITISNYNFYEPKRYNYDFYSL